MKPTSENAAEDFARNTLKHEMDIRHDVAPYRHVVFKHPQSFNHQFDLTTWPGFLCYSGDMGCFVFHRLDDMFMFFRGHRVNLSYWAEKLEAVDRFDGHLMYSSERAKNYINEEVEDWAYSEEIATDSNLYRETMAQVHMCLLECTESEDSIRRALSDWEPLNDLKFEDTFEWNFNEPSYRFTWACHAIRWGIEQYDKKGD